MAANTKGKIIIGSGIAVIAGITAYIIYSAIRKRNVAERIYKKLDDTTLQGAGKVVGADEAHKFTLALDPNFWKKTSGTPLPTKLMPDKTARERARDIKAAIGTFGEDEKKILSVIKKNTTQGQISQIAYAYANPPLSFGNLGDDLQEALEGGIFSDDRLEELNLYINSLPY